MDKFLPVASLLANQTSFSNIDKCTIMDASTLLYQPALRAAVVREQVARLATRLAMARWTSGNMVPDGTGAGNPPPCRAAYYARAQEEFFAWIERGGMWENMVTMQNDGAEAVVRTTGLLQRSTPPEE